MKMLIVSMSILLLSSIFAVVPGMSYSNPGSISSNKDTSLSEKVDEWSTEIYLPLITFACPILFQEDFSNPLNGWPIQNEGGIVTGYLDDEYRILLQNAPAWIVATPNISFTNYIVAVDVRSFNSNYGSYGLAFGLGVNQFYSFEIDPYGSYIIRRHNNGSWSTLDVGSSDAINQGTTVNRLKVTRNGTMISVYANGELLAMVEDDTFTGLRQIGLIAIAYQQPSVDVRFDNFIVYPIDYPASCGTPAAYHQLTVTGGQ